MQKKLQRDRELSSVPHMTEVFVSDQPQYEEPVRQVNVRRGTAAVLGLQARRPHVHTPTSRTQEEEPPMYIMCTMHTMHIIYIVCIVYFRRSTPTSSTTL